LQDKYTHITMEEKITFRLTKSEKIMLEKLAHLEKKNVSDYIKSKLFNWQEYSPEEIKKENIQQSEIIMSEMKKYLKPMLRMLSDNTQKIDTVFKEEINQDTLQTIDNNTKEFINHIEGQNNK
jgi:hypothetical protein